MANEDHRGRCRCGRTRFSLRLNRDGVQLEYDGPQAGFAAAVAVCAFCAGVGAAAGFLQAGGRDPGGPDGFAAEPAAPPAFGNAHAGVDFLAGAQRNAMLFMDAADLAAPAAFGNAHAGVAGDGHDFLAGAQRNVMFLMNAGRAATTTVAPYVLKATASPAAKGVALKVLGALAGATGGALIGAGCVAVGWYMWPRAAEGHADADIPNGQIGLDAAINGDQNAE